MELAGQLVTLLDTAGMRETEDVVERLGVERARERASAADLRIFIDTVPAGMEEQPGDLIVHGKSDLGGPRGSGLAVSGKTGEGIGALLDAVGAVLSDRVQSAGLALNERQAGALRRASECLDESADVLEGGLGEAEIASEVLRGGVRALDEMVGRIGVEEVLGEIFSQFCIGK
jgi:tRNA modification GTPase